MFHFTELKQLHLEITNNCQASCPMCSRNHHGGLVNPHIKIQEWTLDNFKTIVNKDVLNQVEEIYFCGNFGDPLLNNDLLEMCRYIKDNSTVSVKIHTNGGLRNEQWWKDLYRALPTDHRVIFGIDGLEDTHSRYRIGTDWHRVINNARTFIREGGNADWAYIVFEHNQHQIETARLLALDWGFKTFYEKNSGRFIGTPEFAVFDKNGNTVDTLRPPKDTVIKFIDQKTIDNYKQIVEQSDIDCSVFKTKEVYIDAYMNLMPCCFLSATPYNYVHPDSQVSHIQQISLGQYNLLVNDLVEINTLKKPIKDIINSKEYQTVWNKYWHTEKLITCVRACGKSNFSKPRDQFIETIELHE